MRYSCSVCGMNHSRPCDAGLDCGILKGVPMLRAERPSLVKAVLGRLTAMAHALRSAAKLY